MKPTFSHAPCENDIDNSNIWEKIKHINYEWLRKSWMLTLLKRTSNEISDPSFNLAIYKNKIAEDKP